MMKKVCAITVSKNYLEKTKYSIKYLTIGKRKSDVPFWFVRHVGETGFDATVLQGHALQFAHKNGIPYIAHVRHGDCITVSQKEILKKYGVAV